MKFCEKCGTEIAFGSIYCAGCGVQVKQDDLIRGREDSNQKKDFEEDNKKFINNYDEKISYIEKFTIDALRDKDEIKLNQGRIKSFLSAYIEVSEKEPPYYLNSRLAFIQTLLGSPDYVFKNEKFVSAEHFIVAFEKILSEIIGENRLVFVLTLVNCDLAGKALAEWAEGGASTVGEANWSLIMDYVHKKAHEMGWDGVYEDSKL